MDNNAWVEVDSFTFPDEARLAKALLESAGIAVMLENEHLLSINWNLTNAIGGLRLMVPRSELERGRELLAQRIPDDELVAQAEAAAAFSG
jgi:hypothetical protein